MSAFSSRHSRTTEGDSSCFSPEAEASTNEEFIIHPLRQTLKILYVLFWKTYRSLLHQWPWVLAIYFGILINFIIGCAILRSLFPFKVTNATSAPVDLEIARDWVLSGSPTDGVVFIGYAPRYPLIEALMEEAERILLQNGLPTGINECKKCALVKNFIRNFVLS